MRATGDGAGLARGRDSGREFDLLLEELRVCRVELARALAENEDVHEKQAKLRRARVRAQREASILAKALVDVLYRETRRRARAAWWQRGQGDVTPEEWLQVQVLRQSGVFRPSWYLRRNLTVAKLAVDPALHFLRVGHREGRNPGPDFDLPIYLDEHPELRESGENALLHALEVGDVPEPRSAPAAPA